MCHLPRTTPQLIPPAHPFGDLSALGGSMLWFLPMDLLGTPQRPELTPPCCGWPLGPAVFLIQAVPHLCPHPQAHRWPQLPVSTCDEKPSRPGGLGPGCPAQVWPPQAPAPLVGNGLPCPLGVLESRPPRACWCLTAAQGPFSGQGWGGQWQGSSWVLRPGASMKSDLQPQVVNKRQPGPPRPTRHRQHQSNKSLFHSQDLRILLSTEPCSIKNGKINEICLPTLD